MTADSTVNPPIPVGAKRMKTRRIGLLSTLRVVFGLVPKFAPGVHAQD